MKNRVEGKIREDLLLVLLFVNIDPNEPEDDEGGGQEGGDEDDVLEDGDIDEDEEVVVVVVEDDGTDWEIVVVEVDWEEELENLCCFTV